MIHSWSYWITLVLIDLAINLLSYSFNPGFNWWFRFIDLSDELTYALFVELFGYLRWVIYLYVLICSLVSAFIYSLCLSIRIRCERVTVWLWLWLIPQLFVEVFIDILSLIHPCIQRCLHWVIQWALSHSTFYSMFRGSSAKSKKCLVGNCLACVVNI